MFQVVVYNMRYFNRDNTLQRAKGNEELAQNILRLCKPFRRNLDVAVTVAEQIARSLEFHGWLGEIVVREWHDNYDYCPTKYAIAVTIEKSENQQYYVEVFTPTLAPNWDRYLSLTLEQAQEVVEDLIVKHKRRNFSVWIYPQNAPLGTQAVLAITNEKKVKSI